MDLFLKKTVVLGKTGCKAKCRACVSFINSPML